MGDVNIQIILGRVGNDPDVRFTTKGSSVAQFSVATKTFSGQQEYTEWHRVVVFGKTAEKVPEILSKGDLDFVEGRKQTRQYEKASGEKATVVELVATQWQLVTKIGSPQTGVRTQPPSGFVPEEDEDDIPL
jgi:single-strand DNA-binding protein